MSDPVNTSSAPTATTITNKVVVDNCPVEELIDKESNYIQK